MADARRTIVATPFLDLTPTLGGFHGRLCFGVGQDGKVVVVARKSTKLNEPSDYLVLQVSDGDMANPRRLVLKDEPLLISFAEPCPEGVLLASSSCEWHPRGAEKNAFIIDENGQKIAQFVIGHGVQDIRVSYDGTIWVSYFDEGVFGNYGWSVQGSPEAIGASGLAAFDARGAIQFSYDYKAAKTDAICDAYAITLADDGALWIYFYTQFAIVKIEAGRYRVWQYGKGGASALAVRGDRILLAGEYADPKTTRILGVSKGERATIEEEVTLTDPDGNIVAKHEIHGYGQRLYLRRERKIFVIEDW